MIKSYELNKDKSKVFTYVKAVFITLSIALIQYSLLMLQPHISFTRGLFAGIRIGNSLHVLSLITPLAGIGNAMGNIMGRVHTGSIFPLTPFVFLPEVMYIVGGWFAYKFANSGKRSNIKNILIIAAYSVLIQTALRMHHGYAAMALNLFSIKGFDFLFGQMAFQKLYLSFFARMLGYPLIMAHSKFKRKDINI